jgi:hypothetical protein
MKLSEVALEIGSVFLGVFLALAVQQCDTQRTERANAFALLSALHEDCTQTLAVLPVAPSTKPIAKPGLSVVAIAQNQLVLQHISAEGLVEFYSLLRPIEEAHILLTEELRKPSGFSDTSDARSAALTTYRDALSKLCDWSEI